MMSGEKRVLMGFEMGYFDREVRKQQIRRDHPEWSELEVKHEILRQAFLPKPAPEWLERLMKQREDEERARRLAGLE